ncbi:MAG TPA: 30S ribosomal protein S20 [Patescibacteria group bacterium]|nr:30S ribosomal protein S20 [Patescibacteria group bacterium]
MPIIKSAKKRVRVARKATVRNSKTKRALKASFKLFAKTPNASNHSAAQSNVDTAVKKGLVHKNKAARMKKRLAAQAKAAGIKPSAAKKTAAKTAPVKKPATKKPAAKKAAARKTTTKK